jgi:hypothetical protein
MEINMSDQSRRKLLKSIAAGSGAVIAGKSLPESWTKPVVDSVMLPAHAETSPAAPTGPLAVASVTVLNDRDEPEDEIALVVDNAGNYQLIADPSSKPADTLVYFDADYDLANWDYYTNGSNWPTFASSWSGPSGDPNPSTGENNLSPGTYTIENTHTGGNTFRVTFTVSISPTTANTARTMTVTLDSVTQI